MAARKRKPVDPVAQEVKNTLRRKGRDSKGMPTKAAQKAADEAVRQYRIDQAAKENTFKRDYLDDETGTYPALENLLNENHPEYDPELFDKIIQDSGLDEVTLEKIGIKPEEFLGGSKDVASIGSEDLSEYADPEDMETADLAGGLTASAISEVLGTERRSRGVRTGSLEEGATSARSFIPSRSVQPPARTSSRRTTTVPRLKTVKELIKEQELWAGEDRKGNIERPYVQPQALTTRDSGRDLGVSAITSTPEAREAREQNKVRLLVGTLNALVAQENERLGVESGSKESMTIPAEGSTSTPQPVEEAPAAVTPPTPGRVIRSSNAAGRPAVTRDGATTISLGDVTGASELNPPQAPAPVPGRPTGPRRVNINRAQSRVTEKTGEPNVSGMSTQLQEFLRANQMGGVIGAGSRSGGAMLKGADAVTRRVGGTALGPVLGSWDVSTDPVTGERKQVDLDNPATQVTTTDSGKFELVNPLKVGRDPMDPDYVPYANAPQIPIRSISGTEGEQKVREIQAAVLRSGKDPSFTGRRPSKRKDPLPGPTVMEQTSTEIYGPDIEKIARQYGISNRDAARRLAAAAESFRRKEDIVSEGSEAVTTSGEELNILRAKPGQVTSVKGQMTRVALKGGGTANVRTNIPTAEEAIAFSPPTDEERADPELLKRYAERIDRTYISGTRSVLTPEEMAKRDADRAAADKAARQAGMPKPPSKAQQALDRKLKARRIEEEEAPRRAYKALREGPNAEPPKGSENKGDFYDTAGFIRAQEDLPYSSTTGYSLSVPQPKPFDSAANLDFVSRMLGTDVEQFTADQSLSPGGAMRSVTGDTIKPSSQEGFNAQYKYRSPSGAVSKNPTGNPYFKNVNDNQFGGYRSRIPDLSTAAPSTGPAPKGPSQEQLNENIRRADALVAARRAGGFARIPLEGESMSDMARRVVTGSSRTAPASGIPKRRGRGLGGLDPNKLNMGQFGSRQEEPPTDVG